MGQMERDRRIELTYMTHSFPWCAAVAEENTGLNAGNLMKQCRHTLKQAHRFAATQVVLLHHTL